MPCSYCRRPAYTRGMDGRTEYCREHYEEHGTKERDRWLFDPAYRADSDASAGATREELLASKKPPSEKS